MENFTVDEKTELAQKAEIVQTYKIEDDIEGFRRACKMFTNTCERIARRHANGVKKPAFGRAVKPSKPLTKKSR